MRTLVRNLTSFVDKWSGTTGFRAVGVDSRWKGCKREDTKAPAPRGATWGLALLCRPEGSWCWMHRASSWTEEVVSRDRIDCWPGAYDLPASSLVEPCLAVASVPAVLWRERSVEDSMLMTSLLLEVLGLDRMHARLKTDRDRAWCFRRGLNQRVLVNESTPPTYTGTATK